MPAGPWLFPEDQLTDASLRQSRRRDHPREAVPAPARGASLYADGRDRPTGRSCADGSIRIEQTIYVERESQRKIVLGAKGQTIKEIGTAARAEIGEMAGMPVHLFLFVKVRERWADDPERYREMGLDYPKR